MKNCDTNNKRNDGNYNSLPKLTGKGDRKQGRQRRVIAVDPFRNDLTRSNSTKDQRRTVEIGDTAEAMSRSNPVAYYTKYSQFAEDAARLPFSLPLGTTLTITEPGEVEQYTVPGVMAIYFIPTCGVSRDFSSAINRSSVRFYTYLRSNQKASGAYDHQDITMMELSLDSLYMFHAMGRRAYGIVKNFTPVNQYYARSLVEAMGFDYDSLVQNLQDFRAYLNTLAYNAGQYALPADITLFKRHQWMCEGYYTDSISTRAQTYVFVPSVFWQYDNTVTKGSQLNAVTWSGKNTYQQYVAMGNSLLNAVSNEEDFSVISGDIYNFYGGDTFKLPYTDESYVIYPAYSEVVLSQIENLRITTVLPSSLVITQNPAVNQGAIIFNPVVESADVLYKLPMNFHHDSPSSDDVIEATRLMAVGDPSSYNADADTYNLLACGTELVNKLTIFTLTKQGGVGVGISLTRNVMTAIDGTQSTLQRVMLWLSQVSQFDWAPGVWVREIDTSGANTTVLGSSWDIDNIQFIPRNYLETIHTACLFSLFEVGDNREGVVSGK